MNKTGLAVVFLWGGVALAAPNAKDIMLKNEDARKIQDVVSKAKLVTAGGGGPERTKKFTWWRKLQPDGVLFNTLTKFSDPSEIRGQGILFLENSSGENDVQMYLPTFKKIRRVESQAQSGSFMATEFSYSDIATPHVDDYTYGYQREEKCPSEEAKALQCHVVSAVPASDAVRARTGYSKTVNWVRPDNHMFVQVEYYGEDGALMKRLSASNVKEVDPSKHKWMALKSRMENVKNGKYTDLEFSDVKANGGIADSVFTIQNLQK